MALLSQPAAQPLRDVEIREIENAALGRRHPFERAEMRKREHALAMRGGERLRRQVMHEPAKAGKPERRVVRIWQGAWRPSEFQQEGASERRQDMQAMRPERPGRAERPAPQGFECGFPEKLVALRNCFSVREWAGMDFNTIFHILVTAKVMDDPTDGDAQSRRTVRSSEKFAQ